MSATLTTINVQGTLYRIVDSCIPSGPAFAALRAAYAGLGITDKVNVLAPGKRKRFMQLFILSNGSAEVATFEKDHLAARAVSACA